MILSICNEKGGSGKSTLACNLAILRSNDKKILLIDSDPQKSIITFLSIRSEEGIKRDFDCVYKVGENLKSILNESKKKYNDIIVDTGGRDSKEMRIAIALSDIVLIPTIASQFDISTLDKMIDIIKMAKEVNPKLKCYIVINRASTNPFLKGKIEALQEYIQNFQEDYIQLLEIILYEREAYKIATQMGLGVTEMPKGRADKASLEIENLSLKIFQEC
ncbi:chromosome partitioning protein ParA [Helicobacter pullorum]|uniref:AAA family ATPase n=1 Tax=Helicobacter pullorum TaxID=35818 RepID=UPI0008169730|nr:AAA family ATPase [Helicobacter pullorum]OCR02990.1 chromosome partitioning protein ParA [Helicobacter pullorum]OCR05774.1 chromosome partitioning protein ParA [Helicobacter pullorum]OCR07353.1 chromosome partitioning protein ParA [Helicobacter pullorum]OCR09956.1 chromosome partitioning protein ParA [Helicobacter pullorum]